MGTKLVLVRGNSRGVDKWGVSTLGGITLNVLINSYSVYLDLCILYNPNEAL